MSGDFWSRRKAAVEAETEADLRAVEAEEEAVREAALEEKSDEEILQELGLPDPDTLVQGDDFKAFMAKTVPARIRQRAIRKLWLSNPVLANVDGLVDYGEDFTDSNLVVEGMKTAYQVGKGMTRHIEEMLRQAEAENAPQAPEDSAPDPDAPEEIDDTTDEEIAPIAVAAAPVADVPIADDQDIAPTHDATRRRMRFAFEPTTAEL